MRPWEHHSSLALKELMAVLGAREAWEADLVELLKQKLQ